MVFIAEAFGGWMIEQVADAGRKRLGGWLLGSDQQRALRQAATAAIQDTARQLRPEHATTDDAHGADHLARVIDHVFQEAPTPAESLAEHATLLQGLHAGVAARLAVLGDVHITGTGQSSAELLGSSVPALAELLTGRLLRELVACGASGGPLTPLAAQLNHDLTHLQDQQHSASLARLTEDLQAVLATLHRLEQRARSIPDRTPLVGRPIDELADPFALEVHRAIDAPGRTVPLPELPAYVERDHDLQLHAIVTQVADGRSAAAVLVGGSSTGKTRACWEAVQVLPRDWQLWHPIDPSRPEAAAEALPAVGPRTVIWLNEAQHYLLTPSSELGERVAARLRELMRDPKRGPVLVLGTIWPEYWAALTTPPPAEQRVDPHAQARALLTGTDIAVPDAFTGPTLQALEAAARADPRLAEAAKRAENGRITQFLAGAPALLERYRNAPAAAKAVLEAAMDARRLGHGPSLPHRLLEAAAPGYLTDQQWDALGEDWLGQALAYCAAPCRGARGPLTRVRPRPGQPAPAQPHYRLADYLEQTGRARRQAILAPAALWDAFVEHADERSLLRIAEEAEGRSLYRHAFRLYQRAAEAGHPIALRQAAELLEEAGRLDEAIGWYQRAAEAGDPVALRQAAELLEEAGRSTEAIDWYQRAAEAGEYIALRRVAQQLERAGRIDEAIDRYQRAAEAGEHYDLRRAAQLLRQAGRIEEAIDWLQTRAAEAGRPTVLRLAGELLEEAGRLDEAIGWYQRAAEAGDHFDLRHAAQLLGDIGRIDEAVDWYRRAAEAGDRGALRRAGELLERAGRIDEAIRWYQRGAAEMDDAFARREAAEQLERAGRLDEAIEWLQTRATTTGDPFSLRQTVELLEEAGRPDEAIDWLRTRAAATRDRRALRQVARLLERAGHLHEAIGWYQRAAEAGDRDSLQEAARRLEWAGRPDEAIDWLRTRTAATGDPVALRQAAEQLERAGRLDEAIKWLQTRTTATGDPVALQQAAEQLERAGRLDEAIDWYQRAAEAGDRDSLRQAGELLERAGRHGEAIDRYQRAAEAGDPVGALTQVARLLERAGRLDEAAQLRQYGLEPGGHIAKEWH